MAIFLVWLTGCTSFGPARFRTYLAEDTAPAELEYRGLRLHSGQLIVGDEGDADTLLMSLLAEEYSPFVHTGILAIENGRPVVYDGFATVDVFIHGPSAGGTSGGIRRVTLEEYISRQHVIAIFEPSPGIDKARVAEFARARHLDGTPFDVHFDWRDHSSLYCTEFVALALQAGGAASPELVRIRGNPSLGVALEWLKIDTREIVTAQALIRSSRRVALISRDYSVEQVSAYFAAKRELHARFTDDQKLGNVLRWTWRGLELRSQVAAFLKATRERSAESSTQLAVEFFGPQH